VNYHAEHRFCHKGPQMNSKALEDLKRKKEMGK
jgi:hypothetical protein